MWQGRFAEAVAVFREAQTIEVDGLPAKAGLGMAVVLAHDLAHMEEAERLLTDVVRADPVDEDAWLCLGMARLALSRPRQEVAPALEKYLDLDPDGQAADGVRRYLGNPESTGL